MAVGVATVLATPAIAHGPVGAEPGPGATVGGEITQIRIIFPELMTAEGLEFVLTDPDGSEVSPSEAPVLEADQQVVRIEIDRLEIPGTYRVDYSVGGIDGVRTPGAYEFVFDPAADPPKPVDVPEPLLTATGPNWSAFSVGAFVAVVMVALILRSRRTADEDAKLGD